MNAIATPHRTPFEILEARQLMSASYKMIDLGIVDVFNGQATLGITESGQVYNSKGVFTVGKKNKVSFKALTASGGTKAEAGDMNDKGVFAGEFAFGGTDFEAAVFSPVKKAPYAPLKVSTHGENGGEVQALNNNGMAVGRTLTDDFGNEAFAAVIKDGVVTAYRNLDALKPAGVQLELRDAIDVNDKGQILIDAGDPGSNVSIRGAVMKLKDDGSLASFVTLPALPAQSPSSAPVAMNDNGVVVGASGQDGFNAFQPVLWKLNKKGKMTITDLKTLGGNKGKGLAVNNKGAVVGFAEEQFSDALATIWTVNKKGKYVPQNLNDLVATKGMTLRYATGINEKGQIAVEAIDKNFKLHAILLTPSGVSGQTGAAKAAAAVEAPAAAQTSPAPVKAPTATVFATKLITEDQPGVWA